MRRGGPGLAAATLIALLAVFPSFVGAAIPKHRRHLPRGQNYRRHAVATGTGGAVASMELHASRAGIRVLQEGGNAIDAAVATASTLGDTVPFVAGPGGGGFMVIYLARSHRVVTIDGRETCPSACTPGEQFTESTGPVLPLGYYPGDATALQILGHGRAQAIAEPVRLGGGSALAVKPTR